MSRSLDRRTLLRGALGGAVVSVALPPLEAMLSSSGEALATGEPIPDRFLVWFWGNGVRPDKWVPPTTGAGWTPSEELAPLASLVPYVSVVSGCEVKTATHPHHSGMAGIMTGQKYHQLGTTRDTIVSTFPRQSVDQDAADRLQGSAPFRSLEVGVTRFRGTDEGSTFQHLSHNGPNLPNPSMYDPAAVYRRLFSVPTEPQLDLVRASVLDLVHEEAGRLTRRLGVTDRQRLDQHLTSIRALEQRLGADPGVCGGLGSPPAPIPETAGKEPVAEKNEVMSELVALALACDQTRVASVQFSTCGSGVVFWQVGASDGMHVTCHTEADPQPLVHAATVFTMEQLAVFLQTLKDTPDGNGNLLDHSVVLCTSELSLGALHTNDEFPLLIAGRGNGRLKGGWHYRSYWKENASKAVLTALHGAGVTLPSWGVDEGYIDKTVGALFT
ncbi:MAG: DUF1552 domain-containing protein [Alphaproteobacteria bacterium]|nr:DUF1552 domain-containing protein [Alphaproteobacteria bacterium]